MRRQEVIRAAHTLIHVIHHYIETCTPVSYTHLVVVQDRKGRTRDVDEYNRRYDARENEFVMDNDTRCV